MRWWRQTDPEPTWADMSLALLRACWALVPTWPARRVEPAPLRVVRRPITAQDDDGLLDGSSREERET